MRADGPVFVALDGTAHSGQTLRWGVDEAVRRRARLLLVRVVEDAWQATAWSWYPIVGTGDIGTEAKEYLEDEASLLAEHHPGARVDLEVAHAFLRKVDEFQTRASWHGHSAEGNPSGGNLFRGLP